MLGEALGVGVCIAIHVGWLLGDDLPARSNIEALPRDLDERGVMQIRNMIPLADW